MGSVRDLFVTYGGALGPAGYHRVTSVDGGAAQLNPGGRMPSYLWYSKNVDKGEPIVAIKVVEEKTQVQEGWTKIDRSISKDGPTKMYFVVKREKEAKEPVGEIYVIYQLGDDPGGENVEGNMNPDGDAAYLSIRRTDADSGEKWSSFDLQVGDWLDAKDTINNWCVAQVVETTEEEIRVHYKGWNAKWDETIRKGSNRLAPLGTHTSGTDTGSGQRVQGGSWNLTREMIDDVVLCITDPTEAAAKGVEKDRFWFAELPLFLEKCLTSTFTDSTIVQQVNDFLQLMINVIVQNLEMSKPMPPHLLQAMQRILNSDSRCSYFYSEYGIPGVAGHLRPSGGSASASSTAAKDQRTFATLPRTLLRASPTQKTISEYYILNLNHFGTIGGFEMLLNRIEPSRAPISSLDEIATFLVILNTASPYLVSDFSATFLTELQEVVFSRVEHISYEEIKEVKDIERIVIDDILRLLDKTVSASGSAILELEKVERSYLALCHKLLTCPSLNPRIKGMSLLNDVIEATSRRQSTAAIHENSPPSPYITSSYAAQYFTFSSRRSSAQIRWMTDGVLTKWIEDQNILGLVLGERKALEASNLRETHVEIVKRADGLLAFMARCDKLSKDHLTMLWNLTYKSNDTEFKALQSIFGSLSQYLSPTLVDALYEKLKSIGRPYKPTDIEVIQGFATTAAFSSLAHGKVTYGLDMLWAAMDEESHESSLIRTQAAEALATLLRLAGASAKAQFVELIDACLQNIKNRKSETTSILSLQLLIDALPSPRTSFALGSSSISRDRVMTELIQKHDIVSMIVDELRAFREALERVHGNKLAANRIISGDMTVKEALKIRLDFLRFIGEYNAASVTPNALELIWDAMITRPLYDGESDILYNWLIRIMPDDATRRSKYYQATYTRHDAITADAAIMIFKDLLCRPERGVDAEQLSIEGYDCFERYFKYANAKEGHMSSVLSTVTFKVEDPNLTGLETLWNIYMNNKHQLVVMRSRTFIVNLHLRVNGRTSKSETWNTFIEKCMEGISSEMKQKSSSTNYVALSRLTRLLRNFLDEVEATAGGMRMGIPNRMTTDIKLKVKIMREGKLLRSVVLTFRRSLTRIADVRERIALMMKHPPNQVRLRNAMGGIINTKQMDGMLLDGTTNVDFVDAHLLSKVESDTMDFDPANLSRNRLGDTMDELNRPREILSNHPEYFDLLFDLLSMEGEIVDNAWSLIDILPVNARILTQVRTFNGIVRSSSGMASGKVKWDQILDPKNVYVLLYKLQIISDITDAAVNPNTTKSDFEEALQWGLTFTELGGVQHLYKILGSLKIVDMCSSPLKRMCLTRILMLLDHFLVYPIYDPTQEESGNSSTLASSDALSGSSYDKLSATLLSVIEEMTKSIDVATDGDNIQSAKQVVVADSQQQKHGYNSNLGYPMVDTLPIAEATPLASYGHNVYTDGDASTEGDLDSPLEEALREDVDEKQDASTAAAFIHSFSLLTHIARRSKGLGKAIKTKRGLKKAIERGLLTSTESDVRKAIANGISSFCNQEYDGKQDSGSLISYFTQMLLSFLPEAQNFPQSCIEYFAVTCNLLSTKVSTDRIDSKDLVEQLTKYILSSDVVERTEQELDSVLVGYLALNRTAIQLLPSTISVSVLEHIGSSNGMGLIPHLFHQCLFHRDDVTDTDITLKGRTLPKCKNRRTRSLAFSLFADVAQESGLNFQEAIALVSSHHWIGFSKEEREERQRRKRKKHTSKSKSKYDVAAYPDLNRPYVSSEYAYGSQNKDGYVGILNLGCICYMISTLQQFFMIPEFRKGVLEMVLPPSDDEDNDLVFQLQRLFAHLQESRKPYVDPEPFTSAYRDIEGEPIDVLQQQDASEFLTMFFQQVESAVMGTSYDNFIKDTLGGMLSNELLAEGDRYSESTEPFFFVSVPVKNMPDLTHALNAYTGGETVDYTWEIEKDDKIEKEQLPTTRRTIFRSLPRNLLIHLKRFEFDFETFQQTKINDRFEFPLELNMFPYTKEGKRQGSDGHIPAGYKKEDYLCVDCSRDLTMTYLHQVFRYQLTGVVIHLGTANTGHYYSFIRERGGSEKWYEFNDTTVSDFDIRDLDMKCFGTEASSNGTSTAPNANGGKYGGNYKGGYGFPIDRDPTAFMLIYDRASSLEEYTGKERAKIGVPDRFREEILSENFEYWRKKNVFDKLYFKFIGKLLEQNLMSGQMSNDAFSLLSNFTLGTLVQANQLSAVERWCTVIMDLTETSTARAEELLQKVNDPIILQEMFLDTDIKGIRQTVAKVLLGSLKRKIQSLPNAVAHYQEAFLTTKKRQEGVLYVTDFITHVIDLLPETLEEGRRKPEFLSIIQGFAEHGPSEREVLVSSGYLAKLLSFFLQQDSPYKDIFEGKPFLLYDATSTSTTYSVYFDFSPLVSALQPILLSCIGPEVFLTESRIGTWRASGELPSTSSDRGADGGPFAQPPLMKLGHMETDMVTMEEFYLKLAAEAKKGVDRERLTPLISHLLWNNAGSSDLFLLGVLGGIQKYDGLELKPFFRALMIYFNIEDSIQRNRVAVGMKDVLETMKAEMQYTRATEVSVDMLLRLPKHSAAVRTWMRSDVGRTSLKWVDTWLASKVSPNLSYYGTRSTGASTSKPRSVGEVNYPPSLPSRSTGYGQRTPEFELNTSLTLDRLRKWTSDAVPDDIVLDGYDSDDDPMSLVGRRIEVRWTGDRYYPGTVTSYSPETNKHHVSYDDGDEKDYSITLKKWRFIY